MAMPPSLTCPQNTSVSADENGLAIVPNMLSGVTPTNSLTLTQSPLPGTTVGLGQIDITITATDAAGNTSTCTTTLTVVDSTPPTVSCPASAKIAVGANYQAAVPDLIPHIVAFDNCTPSGSLRLMRRARKMF